jgi:hypothetical protein
MCSASLPGNGGHLNRAHQLTIVEFMMTTSFRPVQFHITAFCNGVALGTSLVHNQKGFVSHLLAVHDRTLNIELTVYPYDAAGRHLVCSCGQLYPIFTYRFGRESMLSREQLEALLTVYAQGRATRHHELQAA